MLVWDLIWDTAILKRHCNSARLLLQALLVQCRVPLQSAHCNLKMAKTSLQCDAIEQVMSGGLLSDAWANGSKHLVERRLQLYNHGSQL